MAREYDWAMKYFPLWYRLHSEERYLIWISNEKESLVVDAEGYIPCFRDLTMVGQFAETNGILLESETPVLHDLDWVVAWRVARAVPVDCVEALGAWNLFRDVAASAPSKGIAFGKLSSELSGVYDKLFWGNNLPAMTPKGERYVPQWSPEETRSLAEVLSTGFDLFVSCVRNRP